MLIALAVPAALVLGLLVGLTTSTPVGVALGVAVLAGAGLAQQRGGTPRRATGVVLLLGLLAGGASLALTAADLVEAVGTTDGVPDAADADALGRAAADLAAVGRTDGAFRLELDDAELQALVQQGLASQPDVPVRRLELDLQADRIGYAAAFHTAGVTARGTATARAVDGGLAVELGPLTVGGVRVPGIVRESLQSLLSSMTDLDAALRAAGARVDAVEVRPGLLVITGTRDPAGDGDLLAGLGRARVDGLAEVPVEVLGPGTAEGPVVPGEPIVLALGDSLAAGAGAGSHRDGYVARFHRAVGERDGVAYGLRNLGVPGESSASMLTSGQLDEAEAVLASTAAAHVTIDIGANDLLVHLLAPACAEDVRDPDCQARIDAALERYARDLAVVLDRVTAAAGEARVTLLQVYDPFSLGFDHGAQAAASSAAIARLNAVAADLAVPRGVRVADGFTPMQHTTAVTTHMLDPTPDIHPTALGHDVLAVALLDAATR